MVEVKEGKMGKEIIVGENAVSRFLFVSTRSAAIWLILRLYLGWQWLTAGWGKIGAEGWTGTGAGGAIEGFVGGALGLAEEGEVAGWYAAFLENVVIANPVIFAYLVAWGEFFVGLGLILGFLTGIAAFFGATMNFSFLLAGTLSTNPLMFFIAILLILSWKVSGWYGLDRWALPKFGTPWTRKTSDSSE